MTQTLDCLSSCRGLLFPSSNPSCIRAPYTRMPCCASVKVLPPLVRDGMRVVFDNEVKVLWPSTGQARSRRRCRNPEKTVKRGRVVQPPSLQPSTTNKSVSQQSGVWSVECGVWWPSPEQWPVTASPRHRAPSSSSTSSTAFKVSKFKVAITVCNNNSVRAFEL